MAAPPLSQGIAFLVIGLAPTAVIVFFVSQRRLRRLDGAFYLVWWGLFIVVAEHAGFGQSRFGRSRVLTHEGFHFQMLAAYGLAAFALAGTVIAPLLRRGERLGWFGLAVLVGVGIGAEAYTATITTPHGVTPRWWSWGLALWAYPAAWFVSLAVSRKPIFEPQSKVESV